MFNDNDNQYADDIIYSDTGHTLMNNGGHRN